MNIDADPGDPVAVLLAGARFDNILSVLGLFHEAGIAVDVISTHTRLRLSRRIRRYTHARDAAGLLPLLRTALGGAYAAIIACDDDLLGAVKDSDWSDAERLRALPVTTLEDTAHLFSKIGLSRRLDRGGVPTPVYRAADDAAALSRALRDLGTPAFVKLDRSYGGFGTRLVETEAGIEAAASAPMPYPVLVQRRIEGRLVSAEALYRDGALVFLACSDVIGTVGGPFGLSAVRRYRPGDGLSPGFRLELAALGTALGLDGFANISLIETDGGDRFYFEADARPNAWVAEGRRAGGDPAGQIRQVFHGASGEAASRRRVADDRAVSLIGRARLASLLLNRNRTWSTLPRQEGPALIALILAAAAAQRIAAGCGGLVRRTLGEASHRTIRRLYLRGLRRLGLMAGSLFR